jgi:phospholipid-binding lipoprotein MlaA
LLDALSLERDVMILMNRRWGLFLFLLLAMQTREVRAADDPFEPFNRSVFVFNQAVRLHALTPLAEVYLDLVPRDIRQGLGTMLSNLREPVTAVSGIAAGKMDTLRTAASRFAINSTFGAFGIHDRAAEFGFPRAGFSPGDALCAWGLPSGPYLVLPLLGPTTLRDASAAAVAGAVVGSVIGTVIYGTVSSADVFSAYTDAHRDVLRFEADAVDLYALHRSVYLQRRAQSCPVDEARLREALIGSFTADADE